MTLKYQSQNQFQVNYKRLSFIHRKNNQATKISPSNRIRAKATTVSFGTSAGMLNLKLVSD